MAESAIQGSGVTVQELFYHRTYRLDYYQREYTWSRESIKLLLSDLERRFTAQWDTSHQRERVARYEPYFLGPYVYYDDDDGITYLVDGQQR
ncbi:MAG TPA: DUF262 domain-containing protein, partial [Actinopolymorphaceae bacterium]